MIKRNDRPSFEYDGVVYLLDTGAQTPVWCSGKDLFMTAYPEAVKTDYVSHITGFGSGFSTAEVYKIPVFVIENENFSRNGKFLVNMLC